MRSALRDLVRPWRVQLGLVAAGVLAAAVLDLVPALVIRHVVDVLTTGSALGITSELARAAVVYLAAVVAVQLITAAYGYIAATVAQRALAVLRTRLFAHLLALPIAYHDRTPIGDSVARATADVETIDDLFSSNVVTVLAETVRLITVTAAMLVLSPTLTIIVLAVVPPVALLTGLLRQRIRDAERATRRAVGATTTQLQEDLAGADIVRAFGRQAHFAARFRSTLHGWLRAANTSTRYNAFYAPTLAVLAAITTAALLWFGTTPSTGGPGIGTLTAFVLLFTRFFTPLINLGDEWQSVQAALAGAERVFAVLGHPTGLTTSEPAEPASPRSATAAFSASTAARVEPHRAGPAIAAEQVGFAYQPGDPVLDNVTFTVAPGEHVALVGRSGAGKTSLLALLTGLYQPTTGSLRIAGHDPATMDDDQRHGLVGVVPQTVQLFTGTVHDNVTLGDPAIRQHQVEQACRIAGAHPFVSALPDGYQTVIAGMGRGGGLTLSAGQLQLLALARALVSQPRVLLLDEATAVIDGASDTALRVALRDHVLPSGTAILTVAHRLSTARGADRVIVLSGGRILEQGTPTELAATGSHFAALLAIDHAGWDWEHDR